VKDTTMTVNQDFQHDVFLSHSAKDKAVVRPLAERLRKDELHPNAKGRRIKGAAFSILPSSLPARVRVGLGAVGGGHAWEGQLALSRSAEQGAPLHSPAARRRPHQGLLSAIGGQQIHESKKTLRK